MEQIDKNKLIQQLIDMLAQANYTVAVQRVKIQELESKEAKK